LLFEGGARELITELAGLDPDGMTPFQALQLLFSLKERAAEVLKSS
jgi:hypothetical protein